MTNGQSLNQELLDTILRLLNVQNRPPDREFLEELVGAFVCTVPWESAFRIVRRAGCRELERCARWPEEFWKEHLHDGAGGSCFETNYAFYALLNTLGFESYLTINDMSESKGCHTAIITILAGQKWLVDVGFPLYTILPINAHGSVFRNSLFLRYRAHNLGENLYQVERRPHPKWYAFTLIDQPVSEEQYRQATTADYGPDGHFLDRVIIHKVISNILWRFNSDQQPHCLEYFKNGKRGDIILDGDVAGPIAEKFGMNETIIRQALELVYDQIGENGPKR
jgi:arylamine N-acetyltransferase